MPKAIKLSWQPGTGRRAGRWKKFYKGRMYFFPAGSGKSDMKAYDAAWASWVTLKAKIDAEAPKKHEADYDAAIDVWEKVLAWSNRHGDPGYAARAESKLADLRRRLSMPVLSPLSHSDLFDSIFDPPIVTDMSWLKDFEMRDSTAGSGPRTVIVPHPMACGASPQEVSKTIWEDRLAIQGRQSLPEDESLAGQIQKYKLQKQAHAAAGEVSVGRVYALTLHLQHFQDWLGKDTAVTEINGETLIGYHAHLLTKVASAAWGRTTASHYITTIKGFVRWLWQMEKIPALPRIMDGSSHVLKITKHSPRIVIFTKDEVKALLNKATKRTRLYLLLMLNAGMTQRDISELRTLEVDWVKGRIIRKRSKTRNCDAVPTVNYKLWPETFQLLQQQRHNGAGDRVLLNSNGRPLWTEEISAIGKYKKNDNVKNAFERLRKEAGIAKPVKSLKKTSASLLRDSGKFSSLESLFLGHAPQSMSDRHYAAVPQTLFDAALEWLGSEYGVLPTQPRQPSEAEAGIGCRAAKSPSE